MHCNNNPSIKSLQVVKKFSYKIIYKAFKPAGKLQKTGAQHTQCNVDGHTDLKFPLASGLFKNCQLQHKHTLLKKKKSGEFFLEYRNSNKSKHLLILTLVTTLFVDKAISKTTI